MPLTIRHTVWSVQLRWYYEWTTGEREAIEAWLREHGIDPKRVLLSSSLSIDVTADASLVLHARVTDADRRGCPYCDGCVITEPVEVALKGGPPVVDGAIVWRDVEMPDGTFWHRTPSDEFWTPPRLPAAPETDAVAAVPAGGDQ